MAYVFSVHCGNDVQVNACRAVLSTSSFVVVSDPHARGASASASAHKASSTKRSKVPVEPRHQARRPCAKFRCLMVSAPDVLFISINPEAKWQFGIRGLFPAA